MVQILSFDIGIKNMAYCFVRISNDKIIDFCNLNKRFCLGHSGSFKLKYPVIKPFYYNFLKKILKINLKQYLV